jgi:hypothetical protein
MARLIITGSDLALTKVQKMLRSFRKVEVTMEGESSSSSSDSAMGTPIITSDNPMVGPFKVEPDMDSPEADLPKVEESTEEGDTGVEKKTKGKSKKPN